MKFLFAYRFWIVALLLFFLSCGIWMFAARARGHEALTVAFLDVGQGDAIFIESPAGVEVLIDAGSGTQILRELARIMGAFDRTLDVLLLTHPDKDHIGGAPAVLERYRVKTVIDSGTSNDTKTYRVVEEFEKEERAVSLAAVRGEQIDLGGGALLTILFPDRRLSGEGTNDVSIVARLDYEDMSFLLTGDAGSSVEEYLVHLNPALLDVDVLKVGHHGSRTSSSREFLEVVTPETAIISAGCNNSYGHPHKEVVDALHEFTEDIRSTCEEGSIVFVLSN